MGRGWYPADMPGLSVHTLGRLRAVRALGGAARSLSRRASRGFIRHFPSRAARASTSSPGCGTSLPPPADPPRAPPRAVLEFCFPSLPAAEQGWPCALPARRETFYSFLLSILGILQPGVERSACLAQGWDRLESGVPVRRCMGRGRGPIERGNRGRGPGAGPRVALDLSGLGLAWAGTQAGPPRVPSVTGVSAPGPPAHSGRALAWRRPGTQRDKPTARRDRVVVRGGAPRRSTNHPKGCPPKGHVGQNCRGQGGDSDSGGA